jgi:hypothetical protein
MIPHRYIFSLSVVDRHRCDADPDPTFRFAADPDPDLSPSFTHGGKPGFICTFINSSASLHFFYLSRLNLQNFEVDTSVLISAVHSDETDTDPDR